MYSTFIINTAIANRIKGRFYTEDLPLVEDVSGLVTVLLATAHT